MSYPLTPGEETLSAERERVVQRLSQAFAADELSLDQLESRMTLVWRAQSMDELRALVADLPAPTPVVPASASVPTTSASESNQVVAVFGNVTRHGVWSVPQTLRVLSVFSNVQLDLRAAVLTADVTDITLTAVFGAVEVIVPPGVRVESDGFALFGEFADQPTDVHAPSSAPFVRLHGIAIMGAVSARTLAKGAPL